MLKQLIFLMYLGERRKLMRQFLFIVSLILSLLAVEAQEKPVIFAPDIPELIQSDIPVPLLSDILPALHMVLPSLNDTIPITEFRIMYICKNDDDIKINYRYLLSEITSGSCTFKVRSSEGTRTGTPIYLIDQGSYKEREPCRKILSEQIDEKLSEGYTCYNTEFLIGIKERYLLLPLF